MRTETIDNSGKGNCMYYSYSISLMYFLLKKRDSKAAESVFNKLDLTLLQKRQLHALLNNKQLTRFTDAQIKNIIEPILGAATRKIAAEQTTKHFMHDPKASPLYTATNYGMIYLFRKEFEKQQSELAASLSSNDFDDPDYTNAEIYRLFEANSNSNLGAFVAEQYQTIIKQFYEGWPARIDVVVEAKKNDRVKKTREQIANDSFYKLQYLEELIGEKTVEFFTRNSQQNLKEYEQYLNTNYRWGSEETLLLLHGYVTGERRISIGPDKWDFAYDTAISLELYNNGVPKSGGAGINPDMVLNNLGNVHWVSLVEPAGTSVTQTKVKAKTSDVAVAQISDDAPACSPAEPNLSFTKSTSDLKEDYLDLCGFNVYLQQLETKAAELVKPDQIAAQEAFDIVERLAVVKNYFIAANSTMTPQEFAKKCQLIIKYSEKDNLAHHRGIGLILNSLLNALITLANVFVRLSNLIYGKYELINSDRITTKSMQHVTSLHNSLNALLDIRAREDQKHIEAQSAIPPEDEEANTPKYE